MEAMRRLASGAASGYKEIKSGKLWFGRRDVLFFSLRPEFPTVFKSARGLSCYLISGVSFSSPILSSMDPFYAKLVAAAAGSTLTALTSMYHYLCSSF
jgi:hypothetical protein